MGQQRAPKMAVITFALLYCLLNISEQKAWAQTSANPQVSLTVQSRCTPVNVRVNQAEVRQTPFSLIYNRGDVVTLEALDDSIANCAGAEVEPFRRLIINGDYLPKRQKVVTLTLDRDTSILAHYGDDRGAPLRLSVWGSCPTTSVPLWVNGQLLGLLNHLDLSFYPGDTVRLEAGQTLSSCGDVAAAYSFLRWVADNRIFPEDERTIELKMEQSTTAFAGYFGVSRPAIALRSFQFFHNGNPVNAIRAGDKLRDYTVILNGEQFPADARVAFYYPVASIGGDAEIIRFSPQQIEARLSGGKIKKGGFCVSR